MHYLLQKNSLNRSIFNSENYRHKKFKEIVREKYIISKAINTSYTDLGKITAIERKLLLQFIKEDADSLRKEYEQRKRNKNIDKVK